jgi:hypothetical protein
MPLLIVKFARENAVLTEPGVPAVIAVQIPNAMYRRCAYIKAKSLLLEAFRAFAMFFSIIVIYSVCFVKMPKSAIVQQILNPISDSTKP